MVCGVCGGKAVVYLLDTEFNRTAAKQQKTFVKIVFVASPFLDGIMFCGKCNRAILPNYRYDWVTRELVAKSLFRKVKRKREIKW